MLLSDSLPAAACVSAWPDSDDSWLIFTMTTRSDWWRCSRLTWADYRSTFPVRVYLEAVAAGICHHGSAVDDFPCLPAVPPGIGNPKQMRRSTETFPAHANRTESVIASKSQSRYECAEMQGMSLDSCLHSSDSLKTKSLPLNYSEAFDLWFKGFLKLSLYLLNTTFWTRLRGVCAVIMIQTDDWSFERLKWWSLGGFDSACPWKQN